MGQLCSCHSGKASRSSKGFARPWTSLLQKKRPPGALPSVGHGKVANGGEFRGCYDNLQFQNPPSIAVDGETKETASPFGQSCGQNDPDTGRKDGTIATPVPVSADPPTLRKRAVYRANRLAGAQSLNLPGDLDICRDDGAENPVPGCPRKKPRRAQSVSECGDRWGRDRLVDNTKEWLCDRLDPWVLFQRLQETRKLNASLAVELGRCTTTAESCKCMLDFAVSLAGDSCCDFRVVREILAPYREDERYGQTLDFLEFVDAVFYLNDLIRTTEAVEDKTCISSSSEQRLPDSSGMEPGSAFSNSTKTLTATAANRQTDGGGYFRAEMVGSVSTRPCLYELGFGSVDRGSAPIARDNSFARRRHSDLCHPDESSNRPLRTAGKRGHDDPPSISIAVYNVDLNREVVRGLRKILVEYSHVKRISIVRTRFSKEAFAELFQVFHRPLPPGLTHFDFRMNQLVEEDGMEEEGESSGLVGLYSGLRCAASLTSLNLSSTGMTGRGCRRLVDAIGGSVFRVLSELDLGYNELEDSGCDAVAEFVEIPGCCLRRLRLRHNAIGPSGARRLARALTCQPTLTLIDVSSNPIGDDGSTAVLESLLSNRSLRDLALDDCGMTPGACPTLARALRTNSILRTLTLSRNWIGDAGVRTAAEGLRYNRTVEVLGVDMCGMGNEGFGRLLRELHWCHSMRVVKACYNRIGLPAETIAVGVSRRWSAAAAPDTPMHPRDPRSGPRPVSGDVYAQLCDVLRVNPKLRIFLWGNRVDDGMGDDGRGVSAPLTEERGRVVPNCRRSQTVDDSGYGTLSRELVDTRL